jgi:hypothetical protein
MNKQTPQFPAGQSGYSVEPSSTTALAVSTHMRPARASAAPILGTVITKVVDLGELTDAATALGELLRRQLGSTLSLAADDLVAV